MHQIVAFTSCFSYNLAKLLVSCEPLIPSKVRVGRLARNKAVCQSVWPVRIQMHMEGPAQPARRSGPRAVRARTPFELVRRSSPHAMHATYKTCGFASPGMRKKTALPIFPGLHRLLCPPCLPCLLRLPYLTWLSFLPACPARSACPACSACPAIPACLACGAFPALPACPA